MIKYSLLSSSMIWKYKTVSNNSFFNDIVGIRGKSVPLSLRATRSLVVSTSFHCFVCPRPAAAAKSYIRIFADGSAWKIAVHSPRVVVTRSRVGPRGKERRRGVSGPSFFLPKIERGERKGIKRERKEEIGGEREGGRDIGVCLLRMRPKNRALKAGRDSSKHWKRRFRFLAFLAWETER